MLAISLKLCCRSPWMPSDRQPRLGDLQGRCTGLARPVLHHRGPQTDHRALEGPRHPHYGGPGTAHRRSRVHDLNRRSRRQPRRGRHLLGRPLMIGCAPSRHSSCFWQCPFLGT